MDFSTLQEHWRRLGADDPLWAVYVAPGTRHGGWDLEDFLETGRAEVLWKPVHARGDRAESRC